MLLKFYLYEIKLGGGCIFIVTVHYPASSWTSHEENIFSFVMWLVALIFVKSKLTSESLFVSVENSCIYIYL